MKIIIMNVENDELIMKMIMNDNGGRIMLKMMVMVKWMIMKMKMKAIK